MSGLFGAKKTQAAQQPAPVAALRIQTSATGKLVPMVYGTTRVAPNIIWYGDFTYIAILNQPTSSGGGGGKGFGAKQATQQNITYNYKASVAFGVCEGPIVSFGQVYYNKSVTDTAADYGFTTFLGTFPQAAWTYLQTHHQTISEDRFVPVSPGPYTIQVAFHEAPFTDEGVIGVNGTIYASVGGAPALNQYSVDPATGIYTFNSGNAGLEVTVSYQANDQQPPNEAIGYNGLAYLAVSSLNLGSNPSLENYNFEVGGIYSNSVTAQVDADASLIVTDLMTNAYHGAGFPSALMGDLTQFQNYTLAASLLLSVVYSDQKTAASMIEEIGLATNSAPVWNGTSFTMIPYGDAALTGNGKTYTPPSQVAFSLTDDDFLPNGSADPVMVDRKRPADKVNSVKIEFLNRGNSYNPDMVEAKDQALIDQYGIRQAPSAQGHMFSLASAANLSAQLNLRRQLISNVFTFILDARYAAIDPMDLLAVTDSALGASALTVRVTEITENDDDSFTIIAEEYLAGAGSVPVYSFQQTGGFTGNTNVAPGALNPPIIFEPTAELLGDAGLEIWIGLSGVDTANWGGAQVWVADVATGDYQQIGTIVGPARMGVLTAPLASVTVSAIGQTIDATNTVEIDISESGGALASGTQDDALHLNTLCYVDGEYVAYETATLGAQSGIYSLSYLVRGALGTETNIVTHAAGTNFLRLDNGIFKLPYRQDDIGSIKYIKFLSFNLYGGALQTLSDVEPVAYTITGIALTSPLPVVANVRTQFTDGFMYIYWDDVVDFRTGIRYKIYKGATFAGAQQVGDNAHAPFVAFGAGTYWIEAYAQPVPGLYVYSESPTSITIAGNMLIANLVYTSDQQALGWPGIFSNGCAISGSNISLGGSGDILSDADFLNTADILNYGGVISEGTYEIAPANYIDVGYTANCYVNATWTGVGQPVGQDILSIADFLNDPDILGSDSTQYVNVKVQIATAVGTIGDLYDSTDLYGEVDLYTYGLAWTDWVDYVPGVYVAQWIKFRLLLTTTDPNTLALATAFSYEVSVPPRIDHYPNQTVGLGGLTITFEPDNASTAAPFNGGPPVGGTTTNQPLPYVNFSWSGSTLFVPVIDSLTLSALTFHFEDGSGNHVAVSNVNVDVEGY